VDDWGTTDDPRHGMFVEYSIQVVGILKNLQEAGFSNAVGNSSDFTVEVGKTEFTVKPINLSRSRPLTSEREEILLWGSSTINPMAADLLIALEPKSAKLK
jgi:hypothetical protein